MRNKNNTWECGESYQNDWKISGKGFNFTLEITYASFSKLKSRKSQLKYWRSSKSFLYSEESSSYLLRMGKVALIKILEALNRAFTRKKFWHSHFIIQFMLSITEHSKFFISFHYLSRNVILLSMWHPKSDQ